MMSAPQLATPKQDPAPAGVVNVNPSPVASRAPSAGAGPSQGLAATYTGYVSTTHDALILFQACMQGLLHYVSRRPHDRERAELIRSGNIFIFNEGTSGIKRWTDGIAWSPSRILGNFLVYRQLEKPFAPGEKKRAAKRNRRKKRADPYQNPGANGDGSANFALDDQQDASASESPRPAKISMPSAVPSAVSAGYDPEAERALVGSLVDSYGFKDGGLIKKTMSVLINGSPHHLVSYYKPDDVMQGNFSTPSTNPLLRDLPISPELTQRQNFRIPPDGSNGLERTVMPGSGQVNMYDPYYRGAIVPGDASGASGPPDDGSHGGEGLYRVPAAQPAVHSGNVIYPSYRPYPGVVHYSNMAANYPSNAGPGGFGAQQQEYAHYYPQQLPPQQASAQYANQWQQYPQQGVPQPQPMHPQASQQGQPGVLQQQQQQPQQQQQRPPTEYAPPPPHQGQVQQPAQPPVGQQAPPPPPQQVPQPQAQGVYR
ncbi:Gti1/Pac2 family-domain-containing protein [Kockiozyma suomiensis]|uniref:Gti1/Pac2 family-domain-containing protein n=1 Tax=Kockiozyma suomiensis TaxID=1337062 RepID=UPI003342FAC0